MIALDTNLLVYAHRAAVPEHVAARGAVERAAADPGGWAIPCFCVTEFWAVVTHPGCTGRPSEPEEAHDFLTELARAGAKLLYPRDGFASRLASLACDLKLSGPRIFDLQIALVSLEGGASEIWTHDKNFAGLPKLAVRDPL